VINLTDHGIMPYIEKAIVQIRRTGSCLPYPIFLAASLPRCATRLQLPLSNDYIRIFFFVRSGRESVILPIPTAIK
jgi:hypothetical protein